MKTSRLKIALLSIMALLFLFGASAQDNKQSQKKHKTSKSGKKSKTSNNDPYGAIPIEMMPMEGGFKPVKKNSPVNNKEESGITTSKIINPADVLFRHRVWQEIDVHDKDNASFGYGDEEQGLNERFINVLVDAIRTQQITAYSNEDDRFITALSPSEFENVLKGDRGCDTMPVYDITDPTKIDKYIVSCPSLSPNDIVKFRIKEDWILDKETCQLHKFISGIAPVRVIYSVDGAERGTVPLFWVYYPDLKPALARYNAYDPGNMVDGKTTWRDVFENRMFSSTIIKTTYKNPQGLFLRQMEPDQRDEILKLFSGDNIQDRIFSYAPGTWKE